MQDALNKPYDLLEKVIQKLSHDLTGVLASMRMKNPVLVDAMPHLLNGYRLAVDHKLLPSAIKEKHLNLISEIANIDPLLTEMFDLIGEVRLMSQALNVATAAEDSVFMRVQYRMELLDMQDKALITIDNRLDRRCPCPLIFFDAWVQNLIENAIYAIRKIEKGEIRIWLSKEEEGFVFHIKDTASGMDEAQLSIVFDRFLSKRDTKILPGLGFCREALRRVGGDVTCASEIGLYTHFKMILPG